MSDTATITNTTIKVQLPKQWKVILLNDDYTPMEFVVLILMQIFKKTQEESEKIMWMVHEEGSGIAGIYTKDIAVTKQKQVHTCAATYQVPLQVTIEEA